MGYQQGLNLQVGLAHTSPHLHESLQTCDAVCDLRPNVLHIKFMRSLHPTLNIAILDFESCPSFALFACTSTPSKLLVSVMHPTCFRYSTLDHFPIASCCRLLLQPPAVSAQLQASQHPLDMLIKVSSTLSRVFRSVCWLRSRIRAHSFPVMAMFCTRAVHSFQATRKIV